MPELRPAAPDRRLVFGSTGPTFLPQHATRPPRAAREPGRATGIQAEEPRMPLSPTTSTTVTPSDTVPLPQGYDRDVPLPGAVPRRPDPALVRRERAQPPPRRPHQRRRPRPARPVGRVRSASPPAAPDINHSPMYGSWQEIS